MHKLATTGSSPLSLHDALPICSSASNTTENTVSPAVDIGLGAIALAVAFVVYTGRHERFKERRRARKAAKPDKGPPRWQRELRDRKSTRLNSSHRCISYAVFCF